jgi:hypothetical protein
MGKKNQKKDRQFNSQKKITKRHSMIYKTLQRKLSTPPLPEFGPELIIFSMNIDTLNQSISLQTISLTVTLIY